MQDGVAGRMKMVGDGAEAVRGVVYTVDEEDGLFSSRWGSGGHGHLYKTQKLGEVLERLRAVLRVSSRVCSMYVTGIHDR